MSEVPAVRLNGFGFRPAGASRWAVRGVDLVIEQGERVLLLGDSGAGKSTVLRTIAGILDAGGQIAGEVAVNGLPTSTARDRVGLLLQDPDAGLVLTRAGEDVAFGPQNQGCPPAEVEERVAEALASVGFPYPPSHPTATLSGGERQRLALAGVLAMRPSVLLLDEPTSMLDPDGAAMVREAVGRVTRESNCTLIVVEHNVDEWLGMVDRVVVLGDSGVEADGTVEKVTESPAAANTWLQPTSTPAVLQRQSGELLLRAADVGYRHKGSQRFSVRGVDALLHAGSTLAISGSNGSGKTTLARLLGGLTAPTTGAVVAESALIGAAKLQSAPHTWRAAALAGRIGSVFQNPEHAFLASDVRSELAIGPRSLGRPDSVVLAVVDDLLGRLRLERVATQNPFTLSGGEQRRLSVGAALATEPRVLVLDEPTFGQDPHTWREIVDLTVTLSDSGAAIAVATHDKRYRAAVASRVLQLTSRAEHK
ncbi:MAG: ABC transporter ATP-binding protein [Actinomycetes bacterium]